MIPRQASSTLHRLAQGFPVVAITGPRQSGKTTLARHSFPEKPYVSLENPDTRDFALSDPRSFLSRYPDGAILDEVQRCPDLFSYLQGIVDSSPRMGLFVLTGSQQFGLHSGITQSLAGRVGLIHLLPLSLSEITLAHAPKDIETALHTGAYPPLFDRTVTPADWYPGYIATYVERDVRQIIQVRELQVFQLFLRMCAARAGQLLNLSSLANDCGITHNTARAWLSVLEASYIVTLLQPHHRNFNKRLTKSPKLYFIDTGVLCSLLGVQDPDQLVTHAQRGAIFENWVVQELLKSRFNRGLQSNLYFWRDSSGNEVDVVIEQGDRLMPIEIKSGRTITPDYFSGLKKWEGLAKESSVEPTLVYAGDEDQTRSLGAVVSWRSLGKQSHWPT